MTLAIALILLAAAVLSVSIGVGRVVCWLLEWREDGATRPIRDAAFVAQARAEVRDV